MRVKPHIIRNSNGQFGYSESDVQTVMENLYEDFSEHNIFFIWDCQVNYIDDDDFFAGNKGSHLLFFENGSNSFIDMFFLPSSHPSLFSAVNEIPGNAFFIGGTAYYDNNIELISTRVVSHEMGHCLGLFHTHHTGTSEQPAEYVNGDDCEERGDCVCDTPEWGIMFPTHPVNGLSLTLDQKMGITIITLLTQAISCHTLILIA